MLKKLVCLFIGHKFWEWHTVEYNEKLGDLCERHQYKRCLRCDKARE